MNIEQQITQLLGLATRARKTISGEELVVKEIRSKKAKLVILANDASHNTAKKLNDKCASFNVELHVFGD
ncbi:MAG: ribosomal L7Ae/L30e/S12e/Gadd45 family protein, partial [Psychrobacillus sp.]